MGLVLGDRLVETTTTELTGPYTLAGAIAGFRRFDSVIGDGERTYYTCTDGAAWEVGMGTLSAGPPATLARDEILASSDSGNPISWGSGNKTIFVDIPASRRVYADDLGHLSGALDLLATGSAVARSLLDRFAEVRNVLDEGATGSGTTSDTEGFQLAHDKIGADGGCIYLPPGKTYLLEAGSEPLEIHKNNIPLGYQTHIALRLTKSRIVIWGYGAILKLRQAGTGNDLSYILGNISSDPEIADVILAGVTLDIDGANNVAGLQPRGLILHNGRRIGLRDVTFMSSSGTRTGYGMDAFNCHTILHRGTIARNVSGGQFYAYCTDVDYDEHCRWQTFSEGVDFDKLVQRSAIRGRFSGGGECIDINCGRDITIDVQANDVDVNVGNGKLAFINGKAVAPTWAEHLTGSNVTWLEPRDITLEAQVSDVAYEGTMITVGNDWAAWNSRRNEGTYPKGIRISITGRRMGKVYCQEGEVTIHDTEAADIRPPPTGISQGAIEGTSEVETNASRATELEIVDPGAGYVVGERFQVIGGSSTGALMGEVTAVDGSGGVTGVRGTHSGKFQSPPDNPASTLSLSGTGAGLTLNVSWDANYYTAEVLERSDLIMRLQDVVLSDISRSGVNCRFGSELNIDTLKIVRANSETKTYVVRASVASPGTGYAVGDLPELDTGTFTTPARVRVIEVNETGGVLRALLDDAGEYTDAPARPSSTTGGSGTGLTINADMSRRDEDIRLQSNGRDVEGMIDGLYLDGQYGVGGNGFKPFLLQTTPGSKLRWGLQNFARNHELPPGLAGLELAGLECLRKEYRIGDVPADTIREFILGATPTGRAVVVSGLIMVDTDVPADPTDYMILQLRQRDEDGGTPLNFASFSTQGDSGVALTAFKPTRFESGILVDDPDAFVTRADTGQPLILRVARQNAGQALSGLVIALDILTY